LRAINVFIATDSAMAREWQPPVNHLTDLKTHTDLPLHDTILDAHLLGQLPDGTFDRRDEFPDRAGTLRLFHQRRNSVPLASGFPLTFRTSSPGRCHFVRQAFRRDRPMRSDGGISKDVFHRLAGWNRYELPSATVHNKRE